MGSNAAEGSELDYFWGSVKVMLIVYALAALISMLVAWVIQLLFGVIRRQRTAVAVPAEPAPAASSRPAGGDSGKAA